MSSRLVTHFDLYAHFASNTRDDPSATPVRAAHLPPPRSTLDLWAIDATSSVWHSCWHTCIPVLNRTFDACGYGSQECTTPRSCGIYASSVELAFFSVSCRIIALDFALYRRKWTICRKKNKKEEDASVEAFRRRCRKKKLSFSNRLVYGTFISAMTSTSRW